MSSISVPDVRPVPPDTIDRQSPPVIHGLAYGLAASLLIWAAIGTVIAVFV